MSDFEDRLSTALRSAGAGAPGASGLAPAARGKARARSRRAALTTLAAVVAVAGVVGGVALLGDRDGGRGAAPVADDQTSPTSVPEVGAGVRTESWRDLQVLVPEGWGYGHLPTWCIGSKDGKPGSPVVDRPGITESIGCMPQNGYGVQFAYGPLADLRCCQGAPWKYTGGDVYPRGAWIGYERGSGDNLVFVVTPDRDTTQGILNSVTRIEGADGNGCSSRAEHSGPGVAEGSVRLCRYDLEGWLEQSELLTGKDAADALVALEAAPARDPDRMCTMELSGPTVQITSADAEGSLTLNACQGFTWDGVAHELTSDAVYWALSPGWSGGVDGDVPMPDRPRR